MVGLSPTDPFAAPTAGTSQTMLNFERASLNRKLTSMCLLAASSALLVAYLAFACGSVLDHRRTQGAQLAALAGVTAANSLDALQFNDRRLAAQILAALRDAGDLQMAVLYDRRGHPFAVWRAAGADLDKHDARDLPDLPDLSAAALADANLDGARPWLPSMRVYRAVGAAGGDANEAAPAGAVMLQADQLPMWLDLLRALAVAGGAVTVSMLVAYLLARRVRRSIADPIAKLINTAQKVSASQNYTLRIAHQRSDELGTLIDSFNNMLAQVEPPSPTTATNWSARCRCAPSSWKRPRTRPKRPAAPRALSWPP
jgi:methyl-accepting chemotaxis protein